MYENLTYKFKKALTAMRTEKFIIWTFSILTLIYIVVIAVVWGVFNIKTIVLWASLVLIGLCLPIAYSYIFITAKKKVGLCVKDFLHFRQVFNTFRNSSEKDTQVLFPLIKELGINTRPKVLEAIRHYQFLLLRNPRKDFAIASVLSLTLSVTGIVVSAITIQSLKGLELLLIVLFPLMFAVTLICIFIKLVYRTVYYDLSEHALNKRIEAALSEIWMNWSKTTKK